MNELKTTNLEKHLTKYNKKQLIKLVTMLYQEAKMYRDSLAETRNIPVIYEETEVTVTSKKIYN